MSATDDAVFADLTAQLPVPCEAPAHADTGDPAVYRLWVTQRCCGIASSRPVCVDCLGGWLARHHLLAACGVTGTCTQCAQVVRLTDVLIEHEPLPTTTPEGPTS